MFSSRERQQQVHGHGTVALLAMSGQLRPQHRRRHEPELTEPAGVRDGGGQPRAGEAPAKPGADDGMLDPEALYEAHVSAAGRPAA
jgi:hypothetical protein